MSVFISYRRDGGREVAETVYQSLTEEYNVFLDTESLKNGYFDIAIADSIEKCSDFIIIITDTVFDRCSEPGDWILNELQIALKNNKNIIPVFVGTSGLPSNIPKELKDVSRFNGIIWRDLSNLEKLKSFLISNKRYVLSVVRSEKRITIGEESKNELIDLYKRFQKKSREPAEIKIEVENAKDLSELIVEYYSANGYGDEFTRHMAEQTLLKRLLSNKKITEDAIEYMLQDEMLDSLAIKLRENYIARYGANKCFATDESGLEYQLWTPFLWFDIIEELLKEIIYDRDYFYGNSRDYIGLDCYAQTQDGKEKSRFVSFIPKRVDDQSYVKFVKRIAESCGRADYLDLPPYGLAFNIYPDFFFYLGQIKNGKANITFDETKSFNDVFNLWYYYFGAN